MTGGVLEVGGGKGGVIWGLDGVGDEGMDMHVGTASNTMPDDAEDVEATIPEEEEAAGASFPPDPAVSDSSSAIGWNRKSFEMPPHIEAEVL